MLGLIVFLVVVLGLYLWHKSTGGKHFKFRRGPLGGGWIDMDEDGQKIVTASLWLVLLGMLAGIWLFFTWLC